MKMRLASAAIVAVVLWSIHACASGGEPRFRGRSYNLEDARVHFVTESRTTEETRISEANSGSQTIEKTQSKVSHSVENNRQLSRATEETQSRANSVESNRRLNGDDVTFALKMYWQEGYLWQDEARERFYCLECEGGSCDEGDLLFIQDCNDSDEQRFVYEEVAGSGGGRLKPYTRQDLCWERTGPNSHTLQPCSLSCKQIIKGISFTAEKFEMHPNGKPYDCLEQHHHPKADEVVRANDCWTSRGDDTSYWVMYNVRGDIDDSDTPQELPPGSRAINNLGDPCKDDNKCGLCQGDCDEDDQCKDGLVCFQREDHEPVPGCIGGEGEADKGLDVCHDPTGDYTLPPVAAPTTAAPTAAEVAVELTGNCEFIFPSSAPSDPPTIAPTISRSPSLSPSSMPSVMPSAIPSFAPTVELCVLDEEGSFGEEGSTAEFVSFTYELETDPVVSDDITGIVDALQREVLIDLLPTLFGENCNGTAGRRLSDGNSTDGPVGASIEPQDEPVELATCKGAVANTTNCTVFSGGLTVFSNHEETYEEFLLSVIEDSMNNGVFDDAHPAIVSVRYAEESLYTEEINARSAAGDGGVENPALFAMLALLVVPLVAGAIVWRKRRRDQVDTKDSSGPETAPPSPEKSDVSPADHALEEGVLVPDSITENVPPSPQREGAGPTKDEDFHDCVESLEPVGDEHDEHKEHEA